MNKMYHYSIYYEYCRVFWIIVLAFWLSQALEYNNLIKTMMGYSTVVSLFLQIKLKFISDEK